MEKYMFKSRRNVFLYFLFIFINFKIIKSSIEIQRLKLGLKNKIIILLGDQTIYEIKTNYLHLKLTLNDFNNVQDIQIVDKIISDSPTVKKCAHSSKFCQSK